MATEGADDPRLPAEDSRMVQLRDWLQTTLGSAAWTLSVASADASFRRYFRIRGTSALRDGEHTLIVMDAPPDKEDSRPFVQVAGLFAEARVHVPRIFACDLEQGF